MESRITDLMQFTDQPIFVATALLLGLSAPAAAQHEVRVGAHAVPLLTYISPILAGGARTEAYLTQPTLLAEATFFGGLLHARGAISLEPLTIERGELGAGTHGEGYVDRRHPHTYLHELILSVGGDVGPVLASLSAGRGFAPFGTDDPMMRPFVKFPTNHHLAQILERLAIIGAARAGPVAVEAGLFNGTEPFSTTDPLGSSGRASFDRFGDSWSARVTATPSDALELQASHASLTSPEMPRGEGRDHRKWSVSGRYDALYDWGSLYALAEWSRTTELAEGLDTGSYDGFLAEASLDRDGWRPGLRVERTDRLEEARTFDPFRTEWPHADSHSLGVTRWTIAAARLERAGWSGVRAAPFVEASFSHVRAVAGSAFDPAAFYGDTHIWTLNVGVRLGAGWHASRMGRYGAASGAAAMHEADTHVH